MVRKRGRKLQSEGVWVGEKAEERQPHGTHRNIWPKEMAAVVEQE